MQSGSQPSWAGLVAAGLACLALVSVTSILFGAAFGDEGETKRTRSMHNLKALAMANAMYAADWTDNQYAAVPHNLATYGNSMDGALRAYRERHERELSVNLTGEQTLLIDDAARRRWLWTVSFDERPVGWFRMTNVIHLYAEGDFHGSVFYAPHDAIPLAELERRRDSDNEADKPFDRDPNTIVWSSYAWSPAGLYSPHVLSRQLIRDVGFRNPFTNPGSFRVPTFSQCRYPDLKTHMIEHHWLHNAPEDAVNKAFGESRYSGGEPYYFNHGRRSIPSAAFYDGSVRPFAMTGALRADERMRESTGPDFPEATGGSWIRSPGGAVNGYYEHMAVDELRASPHIFTADGILGRDVLHIRQ